MTGRRLPGGRYRFDDVSPGDWLETGHATVTAEAIDAFAALSGDRFQIHMSDDAARAKGFPGRVAHGLLVLSLVDGLKNQAEAQFDAIASLTWNWSFSKPVFIGDIIAVRIDVKDKRPTRHAGRGILTLNFTVTSQRGEVVQAGTNQLMVHRATR